MPELLALAGWIAALLCAAGWRRAADRARQAEEHAAALGELRRRQEWEGRPCPWPQRDTIEGEVLRRG